MPNVGLDARRCDLIWKLTFLTSLFGAPNHHELDTGRVGEARSRDMYGKRFPRSLLLCENADKHTVWLT